MNQIRIIPLGGVRENGKNMYVVEVGEEIFVLDCGLKFPENDLLGIDVVIPDFSYLEENANRVSGVFLSHGHADAIGALPYFLEKINVPVFGSKLTIELAKLVVRKYEKTKNFKDFHVVDEQTEIDFQNATVGFFPTTHTIPGSFGIALKTAEGIIAYTGDFKFDQSASPLYQTDYSRLTELGKTGVKILLSDSANAEQTLQNATERQIAEEVLDTLRYWEGRIIVACVASNILRMQQILRAAHESQRKVVLRGQNLSKTIRIAKRLGALEVPDDDMFIPVKEIKKYPPERILILESGQMGEPLDALQRMATKADRSVPIKEGDLVFIATTPSIAMETIVAKTEDLIYRAGGTVKLISDNLVVSGHGNQNDLKLMLNLLQPEYFIPVQGEYRQLAAHADLAHEVGIPYKNIFITGKGDIIELEKDRMHVAGSTPAENTMIDGLGVGDIGNIVLHDRKVLSEDGIFIAVVTINRKTKKIVSAPQITSRGFVYVKTSKDLIKESASIVEEIVTANLVENDFEWSKLKQEIREALSEYLFEQTRRRPVILPVIMEVNQRRKANKNNTNSNKEMTN